jgi:hypothetical protein
MGDLLSASSLLMAIAAILFSLWYAEIAKALEIAPKKHREDNIRELSTVRAVLYAKAVPVTLTALLVALIFLPDAVKLILESFDVYKTAGLAALKRYDAVRTAYCFVSLLSLVLAVYMAVLTGKLWLLARRLA